MRGGGGGRGSVPGMIWQYVLSRCNGPFQLLPGGGGSVCGSNFCLAIASYAEKAVASASSGAVLKAFVRLGCVAEWQTGQLHLSRTSMPGLVFYVQNATGCARIYNFAIELLEERDGPSSITKSLILLV